MTLEKLKQLHYLHHLIEMERYKVESLRDSLAPRSASLTGMPKAPGANDKIGNTVPEIVDTEENIEALLRQLEKEEAEIIEWINAAPPDIQVICRLRFLENLSWDEVADRIDDGTGKFTDHSEKGKLYRYLKRWQIEHPDE
ncbi:MAG: hypothetical protein IKO25_00290 [Clostridia bacterium]|nr:hypothetical protein [Clostridia bacterium]